MVEHRAYRYALCHALRALRQAAARSACTRTLLMACVAWSLFLWSGRKILSSSAPSVVIRVRSACILLFLLPAGRACPCQQPAAELVRSHLLPGTVSPFVLTAFDRVHGVGIVVPSVGLSNEPVWVRGVAPRRFW